MGDQEHHPETAQRSRDSDKSTLHKLFGSGRRVAVTLGTILATAVIGWVVTYYAPGVVSHKTEMPPIHPILTDVQDDPFTVSTFTNLPVIMFLPASAVSSSKRNPSSDICNGFHEWGRRLGGADVNATHIRLIVQGATSSAVIITGLSARVLNHKAVNGRTVECATSQGEAQIRTLAINLDSRNTSASYLAHGKRSPFGFTLGKGETEVFDITASTSKADMLEWSLLLHFTVDGKEQSIEMRDRGVPFRTVARHKGQLYVWVGHWIAWLFTGDIRLTTKKSQYGMHLPSQETTGE